MFRNDKYWYIEPQVQLQYTYLGDSDYKSDNGVVTESSDVNSLIGRAGFRLGRDLYDEQVRNDRVMTYYVRGDILHEFMGDRDFSMRGLADNVSLEKSYSGDRSWYDVGFGMTGRYNKNSYLFVDVERQFGDDIDRIWEFNVGVRWLFD